MGAAPSESPFPIVGIGASAGGLEALEQFLKPVPRDSGAAFVIVQHLDPNHKGLLTELLQRITPLVVAQITDGMKVEPNHAYVIPPNRDLSILHGVLHLLEPSAPRGLRLPIDIFLRSLALDQQDRALGVILSGMGSDGTLGLRAIKEKAGAVFVQTPTTAKFDGMPRSAIDAGLADVIAPAEELFVRIRDFVRHIPPARPAAEPPDKDSLGLDKIVLLLRAQTGQDFSLYKTNTIQRRIERRMGLHHLARMSDYVRYLRENSQEADLLFKELLIGVTAFFRDPSVWEELIAETLPALFAAHPGRSALRAWVAGCSTGEEAYSLAMACKETLERVPLSERCTLRIFATDLDKDAIEKARAGVYPLNIAADVSEARLRRYFVQEEHGYRIGKEIREMVIFAPQNLVMDPPFTKLDLITCRNLLIYLVPELQKKIVQLFHYGLNPEGVLLLGSSETIGAATALFSPLPGKSRLYRRLNPTGRAAQLDFPTVFTRRPGADEAAGGPARTIPAANLQTLADQVLLQRFAPAAVLVTELGDILYVGGKTGKYLEPAAGKANWNLLAMARDGLNHVLHEGFRRAVRQATTVTLGGVKVDVNGVAQFVNVVIDPLTSPEGLRGTVMVVFTEVPTPPQPYIGDSKRPGKAGSLRIEGLTNELRQAHEDLQSTREEMQASQEELRSANEELQSTNEELQSMNEELTTSKEELQSMNEELQTLNHELQAKLDELMRAGNDMTNLLNSIDIATLFLDDALHVRRFTTRTSGIIKLIPGDVGRPITDIVTSLNYAELAEDAHEVLRTLVIQEKQISSRDGRWFALRIMPYRTHDNRIDGLVITFADITRSKELEASLRKVQADSAPPPPGRDVVPPAEKSP